MACYPLYSIQNGKRVVTGHLCGKLGPACIHCGTPADNLCDFPVGTRGKTCSQPICDYCAATVGPDMHYCKPHHEQWQQFKESGQLDKALAQIHKPLQGLLIFEPPKDR